MITPAGWLAGNIYAGRQASSAGRHGKAACTHPHRQAGSLNEHFPMFISYCLM